MLKQLCNQQKTAHLGHNRTAMRCTPQLQGKFVFREDSNVIHSSAAELADRGGHGSAHLLGC